MHQASQPWRQWVSTANLHMNTQKHRLKIINRLGINTVYTLHPSWKWKKIKFKTWHSHFNPGISATSRGMCPPAFPGSETARWQNACSPTLCGLSSLPEGVKVLNPPQWATPSPGDLHLPEQLWTAQSRSPTHVGIFRTEHRPTLNFPNIKGMQSA